ncbi:formamidopyrimidine/5-formyluracil/ 5-hydroxymethyluracil DNA glycosylase [Fictibacillus macauensis ZFHKF-1]|uniref:Formamidopyrimidine-DNA glycosylase n=1 Tax=Fictibacillus macauensis ZFHKF-1 TaxID=1196324 RepID=I8UF39_9BACL|nr:DNA-formamidopyrimidine glycosylase [Fictibacillus macauensis]EIT85428.1 formamidopyrimidine/5-formyluracil/ 5-hydroxymethyluracil DNA glycosylase [Fictibacillus macauensis ZFHKF-1]
MPELPEVENVKNTLNKLVANKTIQNVTVRWPNIVKYEIDAFKERLSGQTILETTRRGKFLKLVLSEDVIVSHLRMEGKYSLHDNEEPLNKHAHVIFSFTDGTELRYHDVRKFGTMHLYRQGEEETAPPLNNVGFEPFDPALTPTVMQALFKKTTRNIKAVLLDQSLIAGLGNIYVDEVLFASGIHPETKAQALTLAQLGVLHEKIVAILGESVKKGGSTIRSYTNSEGKQGSFQLELFVYGKKGQPCLTCGREIERTVIAGRGTHFCTNCQK